MQVINNERVILFDVDKTLVLPVSTDTSYTEVLQIIDPYSNKLVRRRVHKPHLRLLNNYLARKAQVIVWSKNGYPWASSVLVALGLNKEDILVLTKPFAFVDDEPPSKWMGEHVFIPADDSFGED